MREENKKNKKKSINLTKIIMTFVLIILIACLGYVFYNKYINKPDDTNFTRKLRGDTSLVEGNTFSFNGLFCEENLTNECTKSIKLSYNNKYHVLKIKRTLKKTEESTSIKNTVYLDDKVIDTLDGGTMYEENKKFTINFDGFIYVVDNKYLAIVTPFVVDKYTNYVVNYYNDISKLGKSIDLIYGEQTICKKNCSDESNILNNLDSLEFDGTTLKYYKLLCENHSKQVLQIGIITDGKEVTTKYLDTNSDIETKGVCN